MKKNLLSAVLLVCLISVRFANAQNVFFYDEFRYPKGTPLTDKNWKSLGDKDINPIKITDEKMNFPKDEFLAQRGSSVALQSNGEDLYYNLPAISKGEVTLSFYVKVTDAKVEGDYFLHYAPSTTDSSGIRVYARKTSDGNFQIGFRDESLSNISYSTTKYPMGTPLWLYFIYTFSKDSRQYSSPVTFIVADGTNSSTTAISGESFKDKLSVIPASLNTLILRQGNPTKAPTVQIGSLLVGKELLRDNILVKGDDSFNFDKTDDMTFKIDVGKVSVAKPLRMYYYNTKPSKTFKIEMPQDFEISEDGKTFASILPFTGLTSSSFEDSKTFFVRFAPTKIRVPDLYTKITTSFKSETSVGSYYAPNLYGEAVAGADFVSPIADARKVVAGKAVTVAGRVTATNQFGSTAYIQDGTAGIAVFNTAFANGVAIGDSVKVSGLMSAFNAQLQIGTSASIVDFTKINVPNKPITPKTITIAQAKDFESQLVTIKDIEFVDKKFIFVPNSNYPIFSGTQTPLLDLRIVNTTNLVGRSKPQSKVSATGILGLFTTTYQLQPRFIEDLPSTELYKKPQTGIAFDKSFKIATWNTNWLGNISNGPTNETLQQRNFQQVLDSLKADLFVLEEVSNLTFFNSFVAKYTNYKGFCTTAVSAGGVAADAQRVCFMYKKGVVDSVSARPLLTKATTLPNYPENNPARFWASGRLPFLFVADANIDGVKKRLHIVGIHARANTGGATITADAKELQYAQRKYDVNVLKDTLDAQFPNANIIIAGDYNDDVDETVSEITSTKESSYKKYVDDAKNYLVITKQLSDNGFRSYLSFNNVIDHITVSNELIDNYVVNSVSPEIGFLYINNYVSTTSDHLPIYATFNFEIKSPTELTAKTDTYDKAVLTWKDNTNNETGFEIERSTDGTTFAKVGDAAVNIVSFTNDNLKDGVKYFYRLRTVTPEGKSKYSNIAEVTTAKILASEPSESNLVINISPNPTSGNVKIQAVGKNFDFSLTNLTGKSIVENSGNLEVVNQSVNGKLSLLPFGVYILRMQSGERVGVLKIVKE
jgi:hypothetical protein